MAGARRGVPPRLACRREPLAADTDRRTPEIMSRILDVLLLLALPASGKSEVRRYLASLTPEQCRSDFHMGPTVQLDDYPYVHMMRRVSPELRKPRADGGVFHSHDPPTKRPRGLAA